MKKLLLALCLMLSATITPALADAQIAEVSVANVQEMVNAKPTKVVVLDANNDEARAAAGIVQARLSCRHITNIIWPSCRQIKIPLWCFIATTVIAKPRTWRLRGQCRRVIEMCA